MLCSCLSKVYLVYSGLHMNLYIIYSSSKMVYSSLHTAFVLVSLLMHCIQLSPALYQFMHDYVTLTILTASPYVVQLSTQSLLGSQGYTHDPIQHL